MGPCSRTPLRCIATNWDASIFPASGRANHADENPHVLYLDSESTGQEHISQETFAQSLPHVFLCSWHGMLSQGSRTGNYHLLPSSHSGPVGLFVHNQCVAKRLLIQRLDSIIYVVWLRANTPWIAVESYQHLSYNYAYIKSGPWL